MQTRLARHREPVLYVTMTTAERDQLSREYARKQGFEVEIYDTTEGRGWGDYCGNISIGDKKRRAYKRAVS